MLKSTKDEKFAAANDELTRLNLFVNRLMAILESYHDGDFKWFEVWRFIGLGPM